MIHFFNLLKIMLFLYVFSKISGHQSLSSHKLDGRLGIFDQKLAKKVFHILNCHISYLELSYFIFPYLELPYLIFSI